MTSVPIQNTGQYGIISDIPSVVLPPNAFSDGRNVRFDNESVSKITGHVSFYNSTIDPNFLIYWPRPNTQYYIYADETTINRVGQDGVSTRLGSGYASDSVWHGSLYNGGFTVIMNNGQSTPQFITYAEDNSDTSMQDFPGWNYGNNTVTAAVVRPFKNVLVGGNFSITDNSNVTTQFPSTIRVSTRSAPGQFPQTWEPGVLGDTSSADEFELSTGEEVIDMLELRGVLMVYTRNAIFALDVTERASVVTQISQGYGARSINCIAEVDGRHVVISDNDVYIHSGTGSIESVIDQRHRNYLFENLHPAFADNLFMIRNTRQDEVWICYPNLAAREMEGACNEALIWNYRHNTWTIRDLPGILSAYEGPARGGGLPTYTASVTGDQTIAGALDNDGNSINPVGAGHVDTFTGNSEVQTLTIASDATLLTGNGTGVPEVQTVTVASDATLTTGDNDGRVHVEDITYTGTRSNVVTSGTDEQVSIKLRNDFDSGPAVGTINSSDPGVTFIFTGTQTFSSDVRIAPTATATVNAPATWTNLGTVTNNNSDTIIGFRYDGTETFEIETFSSRISFSNIAAGNDDLQISVGTYIFRSETEFDNVDGSSDFLTLDAQASNFITLRRDLLEDNDNNFSGDSSGPTIGTGDVIAVAFRPRGIGGSVSIDSFEFGYSPTLNERRLTAVNGPASYEFELDTGGTVFPVSTPVTVPTATQSFATRDTVSTLSSRTWDLKSAGTFGASTVNYSSWNDWVGNFIHFDDALGAASQALQMSTTITATIGDATATFTTTPGTSGFSDRWVGVDSIVSQSGTPATSGSLTLSGTRQSTTAILGTFSANANGSTALTELRTAILGEWMDNGVTVSTPSSSNVSVNGVSFDFSSVSLTIPSTTFPSILVSSTSGFSSFRSITFDSVPATISGATLATMLRDGYRDLDANREAVVNGSSLLILDDGINSADQQTINFAYADSEGTIIIIDSVTSTANQQQTLPGTEIIIDTNQTTNISQSLMITQNDGSRINTDLTATVDGVPPANSTLSSYQVTGPGFSMSFTRSVSSSTDSDIAALLTQIETAVDTNTELPINYLVEQLTTPNRLRFTAQAAGNPSSSWSIVANHGAGDGNIAFGGASVVTQGIAVGDSSPTITITPPTGTGDAVMRELFPTESSRSSRNATQIAADIRDNVTLSGWTLGGTGRDITFTRTVSDEIASALTITVTDLGTSGTTTANLNNADFSTVETTPGQAPGTGPTLRFRQSDDSLDVTLTPFSGATSTVSRNATEIATEIENNLTLTGWTISRSGTVLTFTRTALGAVSNIQATVESLGTSGTTSSDLANSDLVVAEATRGFDTVTLGQATIIRLVDERGTFMNDFTYSNGETQQVIATAIRDWLRANSTAFSTSVVTGGSFEAEVSDLREIFGFSLTVTQQGSIGYTTSSTAQASAATTVPSTLATTVTSDIAEGSIDPIRPWGSNEFNLSRRFLVMGDVIANRFQAADLSNQFDGTDFTAFVERASLNYGEVMSTKWTGAIYPLMSGTGTVTISVVGMNSSGATPDFNNPEYSQEYNITSDYKLDPRINDRFIGYRFSSSDNNQWTLSGFTLDTDVDNSR